ncbi:MAG: hypothetical protein HFE63_05275 [Clostridiales bacterium]|nr:hypothetical protein [Clostridiales bacterium]
MKPLLKKYLLIYLSAIFGIALVITATFAVCDLADQMKPGDQILFAMPEDEVNEYDEYLLKIYAWENVWNSDQTEQYTRLTEMKKGEVIRVGPKIKKGEFNEYNRYDEYFGDYGNITYMVTSVGKFAFFVAEAEGMIEAVVTNENAHGNLRILYGVPEDNYLVLPKMDYHGDPVARGSHKLMFGVDSHHYGNTLHDISIDEVFTSSHVLKACKDDTHSRTYSQSIFDVLDMPYLAEYSGIHRYIFESAVLVSVYDPARPGHILAQAEICFVNYTDWTRDEHGYGVYPELLEELGINTLDNYSYTEAVLYDYWQVDEW